MCPELLKSFYNSFSFGVTRGHSTESRLSVVFSFSSASIKDALEIINNSKTMTIADESVQYEFVIRTLVKKKETLQPSDDALSKK